MMISPCAKTTAWSIFETLGWFGFWLFGTHLESCGWWRFLHWAQSRPRDTVHGDTPDWNGKLSLWWRRKSPDSSQCPQFAESCCLFIIASRDKWVSQLACVFLCTWVRPNPHRTRDAARNARQANGTCWCEWGYPHWMQATSKEKCSNLPARRVPRPVWIGAECNRPSPAASVCSRSAVVTNYGVLSLLGSTHFWSFFFILEKFKKRHPLKFELSFWRWFFGKNKHFSLGCISSSALSIFRESEHCPCIWIFSIWTYTKCNLRMFAQSQSVELFIRKVKTKSGKSNSSICELHLPK